MTGYCRHCGKEVDLSYANVVGGQYLSVPIYVLGNHYIRVTANIEYSEMCAGSGRKPTPMPRDGIASKFAALNEGNYPDTIPAQIIAEESRYFIETDYLKSDAMIGVPDRVFGYVLPAVNEGKTKWHVFTL